MDARAALQKMRAAGLHFRADGDRLDIKAPRPLTDEQRAWARDHKAELIAILDEPRADLHGFTLEQIRSHCYPDEWAEVKDNPGALEAVAADLERHPFLYSGDTHGDVDVLVRCADCAWFGRFPCHPFLRSCSRGERRGRGSGGPCPAGCDGRRLP